MSGCCKLNMHKCEEAIVNIDYSACFPLQEVKSQMVSEKSASADRSKIKTYKMVFLWVIRFFVVQLVQHRTKSPCVLLKLILGQDFSNSFAGKHITEIKSLTSNSVIHLSIDGNQCFSVPTCFFFKRTPVELGGWSSPASVPKRLLV